MTKCLWIFEYVLSIAYLKKFLQWAETVTLSFTSYKAISSWLRPSNKGIMSLIQIKVLNIITELGASTDQWDCLHKWNESCDFVS